jgi:hypothetical protein
MSTLPTHTVYSVTKRPDQSDPRQTKSFWKPIGAAWLHKDGNGLSLQLEFMPLNPSAQLVIRIRKENEPTENTTEPTTIDRPGDDIPF